jgi:phage-related protein
MSNDLIFMPEGERRDLRYALNAARNTLKDWGVAGEGGVSYKEIDISETIETLQAVIDYLVELRDKRNSGRTA